MKKLLKVIVTLIIIFVVIGIIGLVVLYFSFNKVIKAAAETVGPKVTQCPVTIKAVDFSPLSGKLEIDGVMLGNPAGFNTESAFKLGKLKVQVDPKSVMSNRIVVRQILIDGPEITYERGLSGSNLAVIQKNIEAFTGGSTSKPEQPAAPAGPGSEKKIQIDDVLVQNGKVHLSAKILGGQALTIPLPELHLTDIGKGGSGKTIGEAGQEIWEAIVKQATNAVSAAGAGLLHGAKGLGTTTLGAGKSVSEGATNLGKGLTGLFKK